MIPEIAKIFNDSIRNELIRRYGSRPDQVKELDGFESNVYVCPTDNGDIVLKITHSIRRSADYIMGELDFVGYLADNGVAAPKPIASKNDNLVEVLYYGDDGGHFLAYAQEKFDGVEPNRDDKNIWNALLYEKWGELAGRMTALTRNYRVPDPAWRRQEWFQDDVLNFDKYIPAEKQDIIDKCFALRDKLKAYPKNDDTYGLLHGDFHQGNFLVDNGNIKIFDFDDCEYNYFANDIAIPLYYALPLNSQAVDAKQFTIEFMENFLKGYRREFDLDPEWLQRIPDLLTFRDMLLYSLLNQVWDLDNLNEKQSKMLWRREKYISEDIPLVDIDFTQFA